MERATEADVIYRQTMTFNDDARLDTSKVRRAGGGKGIAVGGGVGVVAILLIGQLFGVDLSGLLGGGSAPQSTATGEDLSRCATGASANEDVECRVVGAATSLDEFWTDAYPSVGDNRYASTSVTLFSGQVQTACGRASSAVGPFYCPADQLIYLDTDFYDALRGSLGAQGGNLAQMYVIAHEWGHHISNLTGTMSAIDREGTGPTSDGVRLELQADCYAGAWVAGASQTRDDAGTAFLKAPTQAEIADALDTASAIGDDRIQERAGQVNPETWTHGSSEQRQQWFTTGFERGATACDTFAADAL